MKNVKTWKRLKTLCDKPCNISERNGDWCEWCDDLADKAIAFFHANELELLREANLTRGKDMSYDVWTSLCDEYFADKTRKQLCEGLSATASTVQFKTEDKVTDVDARLCDIGNLCKLPGNCAMVVGDAYLDQAQTSKLLALVRIKKQHIRLDVHHEPNRGYVKVSWATGCLRLRASYTNDARAAAIASKASTLAVYCEV